MNKEFLEGLKEEHRNLLRYVEEVEGVLTGLRNSFSPAIRKKLGKVLEELIELLQSHIEREKTEVFQALRRRLPETDHWQVNMMEINYEMILDEARHFQGLFSEGSSSMSIEQVRESGMHLIRWVREHATIEEQSLFPKLEGPP
jgi:hemerythrin-like domain-containing protein